MTTRMRVSDGNLESHRQAVSESVQDITRFLVDLLGTGLVAALANVEVVTVRRWAAGENTPTTVRERRLRTAAQVSRLLGTVDADHTVRAWFIGMNPQLGDDAPIDVIAHDGYKDVLTAARAFIDAA